LTDHPTQEELQDFVRGTLGRERAGAVLRHVLRGCRACYPETAEPLALITPSIKDYDAAIDRAFETARAFQRKWESERQKVQRILARMDRQGDEDLSSLSAADFGPVLVEALLERSWALRHENPARMRDLAFLAKMAAGRLSFRKYGEERVADLQCRAWAEYANACRVAECLDEAEAAFHQAYIYQDQGSGDPLLTARLMDLHSSLFRARRKFAKARETLLMVHKTYLQYGQKHYAGRAILKMGIYTGYSGEPEKALRLLKRGLKLIDESFDPEIVFFAVHNQLWFTADCGRFEEAQKLVFLNRWRYEGAAKLNRIKLRWLEGRIDAGLGKHDRAVNVFQEVRDGFEEAEQDFLAALTALDMALSLLHRGKTDEARDTVLDAVETFRRLVIEREMLVALHFLQQAFSLGIAKTTLLEDVIGFLHRAEHDPEAKFEPRPL
jgi:tetratricopeptide (TPR) repeat protein